MKRRERDSNPRYIAVQWFSRPPHSTTLPSLQRGHKNRNIFKYDVGFIIFFRAIFLIVFCYLAIQFLRLKNTVLNITFKLISLLPVWILYIISDILYLFVYKIVRYRVDVVSGNLHKSFPRKTHKEIKDIQNKFYRHFFDVIVESIKAVTASEHFLRNKVIFKNIELFDKYYEKNQSIVLAVSHYGNWELGILGISLNSKQKMMGVYKKLNNTFFNDFVNKSRGKFDAELIEMKETYRYLIKKKEECKIIGLLADQSPVKSESNYWTTFLNQKTAVYLGPEKISKKFKYPVLFCSMKKVKRGYYEVFIEELCTNPEKTSEGEITSIYLRKVEEKINEQPEYWLWTHRRWKHKN